MPIIKTLLTAFALAAVLATTVTAEEEDTFRYPLRAGESVTDVARIFRVPVEELIELNAIADPNHLQLGQELRVPNAFARETAELRKGRQALVDEKEAIARQSKERERALAASEAQLRQTEAERDAVARELAATARWHATAITLAGLLVAALLWALKSHLDAALMARKRRSLLAENASLRIAKDRYRLAVGQLEVRYQGLYGKRQEPLPYAVSEGMDRLRRAFGDGAAEIERHLQEIRAERARQGEAFDGASKARSWLFHPLRELLDRHRLKYHTP